MLFRLKVDSKINLVFLHESLAEPLFKLVDKDREYLSQWLAWPVHIKTSEDYLPFIRESICKYSENKALVCAIEFKGSLVGCISYNYISYDLKKAEIGYWLSSQNQGNGIMTRCTDFFTRYALNELGMEKVDIPVATGNIPSQNVCKRLGFTTEGIIKNSENLNGRIVDHIIFAKYSN